MGFSLTYVAIMYCNRVIQILLHCIVFAAYRTDEGKPLVLPVVRSVEAQITADQTLDHEYLPIAGLPAFRTAAARLLFGENCRAIVENRVSWLNFMKMCATILYSSCVVCTRGFC